MASLDDIVATASQHPVEVVVPHPLSYLYLEEHVDVLDNVDQLEAQLNDPTIKFERNVVLKDQSDQVGGKPYPSVALDHDPLSPSLNQLLREKYDRIMDVLLTQRDIKTELLRQLTDERVVVLVIVDGLGYEDVRGTLLEGQPCLVNGPTITPVGYKNVVYGRDETPLVTDLVTERDFLNILGYSYWGSSTRNRLNDTVFKNFSSITRVRTFDEVLTDLQTQSFDERTFIQVSRRGLDGLVHDGKEVRTDEIEYKRKSLVDDIDELCRVLDETVDSYVVAVTADHGILWREAFESEMELQQTNGTSRMRYAEDVIGVDGGATLLDAYGSTYTVFEYPYVASDFDADQGGTHGGLSYQESIVPLSFHRAPFNND